MNGKGDEAFWRAIACQGLLNSKWTWVSPINVAVSHGNKALVALLVQLGADVKIKETANLYKGFNVRGGYQTIDWKENATLLDVAKAQRKAVIDRQFTYQPSVREQDFDEIIALLEALGV